MRSNIQHISDLLYKYCSDESLTDKEQADLDNWLHASPTNSDVLAKLQDSANLQTDLQMWSNINQEVEDAWVKFNNKVTELQPNRAVHRIHFLKTAWVRYAAAVIIVFGIGAYLWNIQKKNETPSSLAKTESVPVNTDVAPGGNRAVLSLADGTTIVLDSAGNGTLAQQGNASIVKLNNGQIVYKTKGLATGEVLMNTMSTPKGGQYQLTLPDGSKVWLNAATSIVYPAIFVGKERRVKVTGEVYFEVAKNKKQPFIVDVDGKSLVEVLGTSFNINSYVDEESIKTTLLEGSVKVVVAVSSDRQPKSSGTDEKLRNAVILKPGQQATIAIAVSSDRQSANVAGISIISNTDLNQVIAWKNGLFQFSRTGFADAMRQLERWYDVEVVYEKNVPDIEFGGRMKRDLNLSQVLEGFGEMGVKFRIEGKKLIVTK